MMPPSPTRVLVAALGGEGGGVLAGWLVQCARAHGLTVQATSVPGVAQRTGSTSYYLEWQALPPGAALPAFALHPMAARVDVVVASELLEAARMIERGFVGPGTTLIASTHRVYTTLEKMAPADGRYDDATVLDAARALAGRCIAVDLGALARAHGTAVSAVMLGALHGAGVLPWPRAACEAAIRDGAGPGVDPSLRGFAAGVDAASQAAEGLSDPAADADPAAHAAHAPPAPPEAPAARAAHVADAAGAPDAAGIAPPAHRHAAAARPPAPSTLTPAWHDRIATLPAPMRATVAHALARCLDFQHAAYAERFLREAEALSAAAGTDPSRVAVAEDAARSLALWMCFDDVIRVADLKSRPERHAQVRSEVRLQPGQVLRVTEMLAPGIDEIAAVLPRRAGAALQRLAVRRGWTGRLNLRLPLRSTSAWGHLLLRALAAMKPLRPHSLRQHEEDTAIAAWTAAMHVALRQSSAYAAALARLPDVLKGYGDTHRRGRAQYAALWRDHVAAALDQPATLEARAPAFQAALRAAETTLPDAMAGSAPSVAAPRPVRFFRPRAGPPAPR